MSLARFSVHRPVFVTMMTLATVIVGGLSLSRLPVDLLPDISYPTLSVSTEYANASPEEMEELITRPIEQALSAVPGVEEVVSDSSEGRSTVRITFSWGVDIDAATNDVRDRLDRAISMLPDDADRPVLRKFDPASFPILVLGAASQLDPIHLRRIVEHDIRYRLERVPGVAAMDVMGGLEREIHVDLRPDQLKSLGIPLNHVINRIRAANITLPAGTVEAGDYEITVRTPGEFISLDQLRKTTIAVRNNTPVRLDEIAEVTDRWERIRRIVRVNGAPGLRLAVNKQSGTNTVDVAKRVLVEIDRINQDIPQVNIVPIIDSSKYIERSISNVGASALYGGLFAIIVLLVFLRSIRSTGIIAISIPVSIIATFAMIYFGGFTLNLMTLGGLALGVGMLVDNSIVVLENIFRLRSEQRSPERAAVRGTSEVTWAIIASTLTTLAIFLPMVFLRGMAGIMFKQLAFVVSFSLVCSLIVALTLIPMLSARLLRVEASAGPLTRGWRRRLFDATGAAFTWLELHYKSLLHFALQHRLAVLAFAALLLAGSLALTPFIGSELMPQGDEGEVRVEIELEVGTRIGLVDNTVQLIESIIEREVPEMESMVASIGGGGWGGGAVNEAEIRLALVPMAKRDRSSEDVAAALRRRLSGIPGTTIRTRAGQGMFLLRRMMGGSARIEVEIRGYDLDTADKLAQQVRSLTERVPGVTDTQLSRESGAPERLVRVDRAKAEAMKVEVQDIAGLLQTIVSGTRAGNFRDAGEEFAIRVKLKDSERIPLSDLLDMTVTNADGVPIVLRNFVSLEPRRGMMQVERKNQERIVTVRANIADRDMSSILADIRQQLDTIPAPPGFTIGFGGDYADQQETFRELALGLVLSLLLVYIVMACLYESLRDPFVVMFSVPLAIIGVVLMLFLTGTTLNMQSFIGIIMLGGIVVNNAILLVDYTNLLRREEGMDLRQAIEEAGRRRLRPIMMTAFTTIFGLIPLALGLGEGGEAQAPMARAVVGGLVSSTLVTLVVVPVIYSYFHQNTNGRGRVAEDIGDLGPAEGM